jgi:hypothetical protein
LRDEGSLSVLDPSAVVFVGPGLTFFICPYLCTLCQRAPAVA